jgi:hypothetical protein
VSGWSQRRGSTENPELVESRVDTGWMNGNLRRTGNSPKQWNSETWRKSEKQEDVERWVILSKQENGERLNPGTGRNGRIERSIVGN